MELMIFQYDLGLKELQDLLETKLSHFGKFDLEYEEVKGKYFFEFHNFWSLLPNFFDFKGSFAPRILSDDKTELKIETSNKFLKKFKKILMALMMFVILFFTVTFLLSRNSSVGLPGLQRQLDILFLITILMMSIFSGFYYLIVLIASSITRRKLIAELSPQKIEKKFRVHLYSFQILLLIIILFILVLVGILASMMAIFNYLFV